MKNVFNNIIVTTDNFGKVSNVLGNAKYIALDTETTGLNSFKGARIFSLILSTKYDNFYFSFNEFNTPKEYLLDKSFLSLACKIIDRSDKTIFIHNAKFDLKMLYADGIELKRARVWCTQAIARLVNNVLPSYSLANLGKLIGHDKDDSVEKIISKNKLYTLVDTGKKSPIKNKHYDKVPFDIIVKYGFQDGRVCFELGRYELDRLKDMDQEHIDLGLPPILPLLIQEIELTQVLFKMELKGISLDVEKTQKAYDLQVEKYKESAAKFEALTGIYFEDSPKVLKAAFKKGGFKVGVTEKGNPSFSSENLPDNTLGKIIKEYRSAYKLAGTYYRNFLDIKDENNIIHCSFNQGGTLTGRMSCLDPNLQNVPKRNEDNNKYPVRSCFVPRKGYFFLMIDYDQMEYRLLLDLADEVGLIEKIKGGLDVHTATANEIDIDRFHAKTLNFALLYGSGIKKIAKMLGIPVFEASLLKQKYFRSLTAVKNIIFNIKKTSEKRGFLVNPFGRRLTVPDNGAYKMPNHYIQGGCGDIVKKAMVKIDKALTNYKSNMLLQIHDELLIEIAFDEQGLTPLLLDIMQDVYRHDKLKLTAGCDYSTDNWHNKEKYKRYIHEKTI